MRLFIVLVSLIAALFAAAQGGTLRITPKWNVGETRKVSVVSETKTTLNDSFHITATARSSYTLKVLERRKDRFVVDVFNGPGDQMPDLSDFGMSAPGVSGQLVDSVFSVVQELLAALITPLLDLTLRFEITMDGTTSIQDPDQKLKDQITQGMIDGFQAMVEKIDTSAAAKTRLDPRIIEHVCDSIFDGLVASMENEMTYFLGGYAHDYPLSGSRRSPVMVHDVDAPLRPDSPELPAIMEIGFDQLTKDHAVAREVTEYDREALRAAFDKEGDVFFGEMRLSEEAVYVFDRKSGWMESSTVSISLSSENISMSQVTKTVISEL